MLAASTLQVLPWKKKQRLDILHDSVPDVRQNCLFIPFLSHLSSGITSTRIPSSSSNSTQLDNPVSLTNASDWLIVSLQAATIRQPFFFHESEKLVFHISIQNKSVNLVKWTDSKVWNRAGVTDITKKKEEKV